MWSGACHAGLVRCRPGLASAAVLAALGCAPRPARADVPALPVKLDFQADAACPDSSRFLARIHSRTPLRVSNDSDALVLRVVLRSSAGGFHGQLRTGVAEVGETREVSAATCEEVADALALIGALIVERSRREQAEQRPAKRAPRAPARAPAVVDDRASAPQHERPAILLGAEALIARPLTSDVLTGGSLSMFVDAGLSWWLSAGYARNDLVRSPARAELGYGAINFGLGPPSLKLTQRARLALAVCGEGGFVTADGLGVDVPMSARRSYWALGVLARLQWAVFEQGFFSLQGAGLVPLVERGFSTREPYERVATTTIIAPKMSVGFGLGF
jgi:hypothetical protein